MPLILISGIPSSGKSTRAKELKKFFEEKSKTVHLVGEGEAIFTAGFSKNDFYLHSPKENIVRGALKSDVFRLLSKDNVVIFDGGNYIKGYRYELYCGSKAARSTQCTILCAATREVAWDFNKQRISICGKMGTDTNSEIIVNQNETINNKTVSNDPYTQEVFDALCLRYEEPNSNNRWDSPLITVFPEDIFDFGNIYNLLFENKPPAPNMSTQNPPLSATNYLYEMDKITQEITTAILTAQKLGQQGEIVVPGKTRLTVDCPGGLTAGQLTRLRRQFLNYSKMHSSSSSVDQAAQLFVQFLNTSFK